MKRLLTTLTFVVALAFWAGTVQAQTGIAQGKVVDANGQPLVDAKVEISYEGGVTHKLSTKTNKRGEYIQVGLQPGVYKFTASKEGYGPFYVEYKVNLGDPTTIPDIKLTPASAGGGAGAAASGGKSPDLGPAVQNALDLTKSGKFDEAEVAYNDLITKSPSTPGLHFNLAYVYTQKKDWPKAEAEYLKVIELKPDYSDAYIQLARVYQDQGNAQKATEFIAKAASDHPTDSKIQFTVGLYFLNASKADDAAAAFTKAEALDPSNAEIQFYLGILAVQQNKTPDAIAHLQKYLSMTPTNQPNIQTAQGLLQALKPKP
jgi:tetratricopeptide (TPR) repeat protein